MLTTAHTLASLLSQHTGYAWGALDADTLCATVGGRTVYLSAHAADPYTAAAMLVTHYGR